jgi:hypothetical protein
MSAESVACYLSWLVAVSLRQSKRWHTGHASGIASILQTSHQHVTNVCSTRDLDSIITDHSSLVTDLVESRSA